MAPSSSGPPPKDRSLLTHPIAIGALLLLIVNDHLLKAAVPGLLTGKLSDFAGLAFFPLLLAEVVVAAGRVAGRGPRRSPGLVALCAAATGVTFVAVKTTTTGSLAVAWGLGGIQWLATLAWFRGEPPMPVAVAIDPSDLLALPALLAAMLVAVAATAATPAGAQPSGSRRATTASGRIAGPALALVAGVASIATSQGVPTATGRDELGVRLDAAHPAVAYHVTWSAAVASTDGYLGVDTGAEPMRVTLVPDGDIPDDCVSGGPASQELELGGPCGELRRGGATVLVEATEAIGEDDLLRSTLTARLSAYMRDEAAASAAIVQVAIDREPLFDGRPATASDAADGSVRVTAARPERRISLVLEVDAKALRGPLDYPLVGRIQVGATLQDSNMGPGAASAWFAVGDDEDGVDVSEAVGEADWLQSCKPKAACRVPVTLTIGFVDDDDDVDVDAEGARGWATVTWSVEATLEAFDGRTLPAGALRLVKP